MNHNKMKLLIIFLSLIVTFTKGNNISDGELEVKKILNPIDFTGKIQEIIDTLKANGTYDPYHFNENVIVLGTELDIKFYGKIKGAISGLLSVVPKQMDVNILSQIEFDIEFPEVIKIKITKYDFKSWLLGFIKIYGNGELSIKLENVALKAKGKVKFEMVDGVRYVSIKHVTPDLSIKRFEFQITGFLNDEKVSASLSELINNMAPILFQQNIAKINEEINDILVVISEKLKIKY